MSTHILDRLGLRRAAEADALTAGTKTFVPVHVGTHDVTIGALLNALDADPALLPPRTGHLGNWEDIAAGRSGPMDFNTAICGGGHGYPLIYGFTRTEADTEGGDEAYQPGSLIEKGKRHTLPLHTWDGTRFVRRDRSKPLFCPLVQAEVDGQLVPLVELHWQRMLALPGYRFRQWAAALTDRAPLVTDMLTLLLEQAAAQGRNQAFAELISQAVRLDGEVSRCDLRPEGTGYVLDGHRYPSARALAEAVMLTVRALVEPAGFFARMRDLPPVLPVMSLQLTNVLFALLDVHHPDAPAGPPESPFITHLHWGARAMAGCPPRRGGYLSRRSTVRSLRAITDPLVRHFDEAGPVAFVLLPAQAFMLCPPSTAPDDAEVLAELFRGVRAAGPEAAYDTTLTWLDSHRERLSEYLRGRFRSGSGVPADDTLREAAVPVEPEGFRELTFRQACGAVAAFEEVLG
ncbi:hypothetical protein GCM10010313_15590 [Streptomyces violarus]|uniref:Uncharacterized protein n=1 Tax=Streptomyces violarus TaxID=67380 RepID=A0A7W4ZM68_9ACTN|nr:MULTISPECIES: DUF6025 family protein [Streptomyces]MBB3075086.1 hypothetical protein [Streptomyces violarus]WRT97721.1 DUF6025 family protein [Streptomyces sp. CGMCC 4.1772]GHD02168.1 hypothetical protein GCM10010313_15590 [Streptomyces violarus]